MKKKYLILLLCLILILLTGGGYAYYYKTHNFKNKINVKTGDLVLKNAGKANIQIVTGDVSEIQIDLKGDPEELKKINFSKIDSLASEFSLPNNSRGITGKITVPKNIKIVDLDKPLSIKSQTPNPKSQTNSNTQNTNSKNTSSGTGGSSSSSSTSSSSSSSTSSSGGNKKTVPDNKTQPDNKTALCGNLVIETGEQCDDGNRLSGDGCSNICQTETAPKGCGNSKLELNEQCDDGNTSNGDGCSAVCTIENLPYSECTLLIKQEERNTCCQQLYVNTSHEDCTGYWIFDYNTRLCRWHCPKKDCGSYSSQSSQNACCTAEKKNEIAPLCSGNWVYNTSDKICEYKCADFSGNEDKTTDKEIDSTSTYCINTYSDINKQSQCCDDFLKHPLSIGSDPGSPDCLGKWYIPNGGIKCIFKCATYEERIEILKKLKQNQ